MAACANPGDSHTQPTKVVRMPAPRPQSRGAHKTGIIWICAETVLLNVSYGFKQEPGNCAKRSLNRPGNASATHARTGNRCTMPFNASDGVFCNTLRVQVNDAHRNAVNPNGEEGVEPSEFLHNTATTSEYWTRLTRRMQNNMETPRCNRRITSSSPNRCTQHRERPGEGLANR
jgi:hypothetical protein